MERAIFAAGCGLGVNDVFRRTTDVGSTTVGYSGGTRAEDYHQQYFEKQRGGLRRLLSRFR